MSITKKILEEKNYLLSLENIKQKELAKKDEMEVELQKNKKEQNALSKEQFELREELTNYHHISNNINFNIFIKFLIALIITILVIKFIPAIYAHLLQNLILFPFYFYLSYKLVKETNDSLEYKHHYHLKETETKYNEINKRIQKLKQIIALKEEIFLNLTSYLKVIDQEITIHNTYLLELKNIVENFTLNAEEEKLANLIYPKGPTLKLKKK